MKNNWLEKEIRLINQELKCKNERRIRELNKKHTVNVLFYTFVAIFLGACFLCNAHPINHNDKFAGRGFWGDTWECRSCGYENYVQFETCAVCGKGKRNSKAKHINLSYGPVGTEQTKKEPISPNGPNGPIV